MTAAGARVRALAVFGATTALVLAIYLACRPDPNALSASDAADAIPITTPGSATGHAAPVQTGVAPPPAAPRAAAPDDRLASSRALLAAVERLSPTASVIHGPGDPRAKLRALAALPLPERRDATWALCQAWAGHAEVLEPILAMLQEEADPRALEVLTDLFRGGVLPDPLPADALAAVLDVLRSGEPTARRVAAAWASRNSHHPSSTPPGAWVTAMEGVLGGESAPDVLQALAQVCTSAVFFHGAGPPSLVESLRRVAVRLPPCPARREVWTAIAASTVHVDGTAGLHALWSAAPDPDAREEIAAGIADVGFPIEGSGLAGGEDGLEAAKREAGATQRAEDLGWFLEIYGGTHDLSTRQSLIVRAEFGVGFFALVLDPERAAPFFRDVRAVEPDPAQRERIDRLLAALRARQVESSDQAAAILRGTQ